MKTLLTLSGWVICGALFGVLAGCEPKTEKTEKDTTQGESKKVEVGANVVLEVLPDKKRRVLIEATVCLREGQLEQLLCRNQTKEHESILTAAVDARDIHKALLLAGAEKGAPVQFTPKFKPASGTTIKVTLRYEEKGKDGKTKTMVVPGREWVRNVNTKKDLDTDWVFAGSRFIKNELDPTRADIYLANEGDLLCLCNMESALMDLPIASPKALADRVYEANTDRVPPKDTKVTVILEPVLEKKSDK
jgi:hypothetical protein